MKLKTLLAREREEVALVIGNGINRFNSQKASGSWEDLINILASKHVKTKVGKLSYGISLTELFDILELSISDSSDISLQKEFCELMRKWQFAEHHTHITNWAKKNNSPIITTNFEPTLSESCGAVLRRSKKGGFTYYYPWESYYSTKPISDPSREFGIWHLNGMQRYPKSVRLGLTHYMGSAARARTMIHKGSNEGLFQGKSQNYWNGRDSWLHIIFNTPLLMFGLGLNENEVFMRWLLIERAKYFRKFPERKKKAWYVVTNKIKDEGKRLFLESVGIEIFQVQNYEEIYGATTWKN